MEATSFLPQSLSSDELDILVDDSSPVFSGRQMRGRFEGMKTRVAAGTAVVCALGCVAALRHQPATVQSSTAFLHNTLELDGFPPQAASRSLLKPVEGMHDGNLCDASEELYGGLCYKRCDLLTHAQAPIRTSSWTCCEGHPCSFSNQRGSIGTSLLCNGYDVDGKGGCPHKPGACLLDEELHLGVCYKKCSILTEGVFPNRVAAATCCKTKGLGCLDIRNDKTSDSFAVGGGAGDHDGSTPNQAHLPMQSLTEAGDGVVITSSTTVKPASSQFVADAHFEPEEHLHDGNVCDDQEEQYGGLCYKKCGLLTSGAAPIRTSSWTCCKSRPCTLFNQMGSIGHSLICNGYDISATGACPHKPGACLVDEEMELGVCYKKCSLLTSGAFPYRLTAVTCCKEHGLGCLNPRNDMTSDAFNVGGDRHHSKAHLPDEALTEAGVKQQPEEPVAVVAAPVAPVVPQAVGLSVPPPAVATASPATVAVVAQPQQPQQAPVAAPPAPAMKATVFGARPLGSALPKPKVVDESGEQQQAFKAQEAQKAVAAMIRAMKK